MSKSQEYAVLNELLRQDTVADVFDLSNPEAEASQYLWVPGHPGLHRECQDYEVSAHVCMCGEESLKNWNSLLHLLKKKVHSGSYSAKIKLVDSMKWIQVNKQEGASVKVFTLHKFLLLFLFLFIHTFPLYMSTHHISNTVSSALTMDVEQADIVSALKGKGRQIQ